MYEFNKYYVLRFLLRLGLCYEIRHNHSFVRGPPRENILCVLVFSFPGIMFVEKINWNFCIEFYADEAFFRFSTNTCCVLSNINMPDQNRKPTNQTTNKTNKINNRYLAAENLE